MIGQQQKDQAENWFKNLRDKICEEFEILEEDHLKLAPKSDVAAKKFERKSTKRETDDKKDGGCLLYTSPSPRDRYGSRMPSSA